MSSNQHWRLRETITALLVVVGVFACTSAQGQTGTAVPAPIVELSVNQPSGGIAYNGWPLVIQVDLYNPDFAVDDAAITPIPLRMSSASWADALSITVTDSTGAIVNWPLHQVLRPTGTDASITLDAETSGHLVWWVAPTDTAALATGTFQIAAVLNTTTVTDPAVFKGQSYSTPVTLTLQAEPSGLPADQQESKYLMAAFYDTLAGNNAQAMTDVNTLLTSQPQNIRGLMAKGQLLEASGDAINALASYDAAVSAFYSAIPKPPEPPLELLEQSANLRNSSITQSAGLPAPQIGLQLQNFTQTSHGIYQLDLQVTNNGSGVANNFAVSEIKFATVSGSGQVSLDSTVQSQLPATLDSLAAGASATVQFSVNVPSGVSTFTATEAATVQNVIGSSSNISGNETVYVVTSSPSFTSANTATFVAGSLGAFSVTTTGAPPASITETGTLPNGLAFKDNGDGSGTLAGTAAAGSGGQYALVLEAANGVGSGAAQNFTLLVNEGPTIQSANSTTFTVATAGTFSLKTAGFPVPTLSESGVLPRGVSFTGGVLSGTPAAGTGGVYPLTFNATNLVSSASQNFTLTVNEAANFTSATTTTFSQGTAGSFTITCAGFPIVTISESGALPAGVTFVNNGNGTATLIGTPTVGGTFNLILTGSNGIGGNATQNFTLTVSGGSGGGATLGISPASITFGNVKFGRHATQTVVLTNTGTSPVVFGRMYLTYGPHTDKDDFELDRNCGVRLLPQKTCTLRVVFEADDLGTSSAALNIVDNAQGNPQTVPITATTVK